MEILQTNRLRLVPLTVDALAALLSPDTNALELRGIAIGPGLVDSRVSRAIRVKLEKTADAPPEDHAWWTYWVAIAGSSDRAVGLVGFKGVPEDGEVEIGYGIAPSARGRGFATEAAERPVEWALSDPRCRGITALGVAPDNRPSERVLEKLGMKLVCRSERGSDWSLGGGSLTGRKTRDRLEEA